MSAGPAEQRRLRVLYVEDSPLDAELTLEALRASGHAVEMDVAEDRDSFVRRLGGDGDYDVILADFALPAFDAHAALELTRAARPDTPFICVSGTIGEEATVELLKNGADDCVLKDRMARLPYAVERAIAERTRRRALAQTERRFQSLFENLLNGYAYCRMIYDDAGEPVDFVYLEVNPAFERLTGLRDVVGKPVSEVVPSFPEQSPELIAAYGRVARTGIPETLEFHVRPLGTWHFIAVYSTEPGTFIAVFEDVTARRTAVSDLLLAADRLRRVVEGSVEASIS